MLALSRKKDESIIINNNIEITILEVKGDQVKIGIQKRDICTNGRIQQRSSQISIPGQC